MFERIIGELGPWNWMVLGLILLTFEIIAPGVFLLWIGIAALIVGAASLALWDAAFWSWQLQTVIFAVLAVICALAGKRIYDGREGKTDQPLLNQRGAQLIGRTATLTEPIVNGRGRVHFGDTLWRISGPDLPAGVKVRVTKADATDLELVVEAA